MPSLADSYLTDIQWEPWSLYIFGEFGCGKSVLAASAPDPLHFMIERGYRTFRKDIHKDLAESVRIIPILSGDRVQKLRNFLPMLQNKNDPEAQRIKTIVFDTTSTLQKRDLQLIMKEAKEKNDKRDIYVPSEAEYTKTNRKITQLIQDYIDMSGKNVIILAHVKEEKDDDGNTVLIRPGNSNALYGAICELVDGVFYMRSDTDSQGVTKRELRFMASRKIIGKNRFDFPVKIDNPDFQRDLLPILNK